MSKTDPYAGSPYDASGMPLGAETVDYDVAEDVAAKTVFDKPVTEFPEVDYTPRAIDPELLVEVDPANFNGAISVDTPKEDSLDFLEAAE